MFFPQKQKPKHFSTLVSRKSTNRFIEHGLRVISAKPHLYFHQTLTFPTPILAAKDAKLVFTRFIKCVLKFYRTNSMSVFYVQERRKDRAIHFHVCFLFFCADQLPYAPSRMRRDFRTDIFNRWNRLNGLKAVRVANALIEHQFNLDSLEYFARALIVVDESISRAETIWWGIFNRQQIASRGSAPTSQQKKTVFNNFFTKCAQANESTPSFIVQPLTIGPSTGAAKPPPSVTCASTSKPSCPASPSWTPPANTTTCGSMTSAPACRPAPPQAHGESQNEGHNERNSVSYASEKSLNFSADH